MLPAGGGLIAGAKQELGAILLKNNYQFGFCFRFGFKSRSFCGIGQR